MTSSVSAPRDPRDRSRTRPTRSSSSGRHGFGGREHRFRRGGGFADLAGYDEALLAAQSSSRRTSSAPTSRSAALKDLFSQIDADGNGQITKSEFENALGAGGTNRAQADNVFDQLDTNGDGSVSLGEMSAALKGGHRGHYHADHRYGSGSCGSTDRRSGCDRRLQGSIELDRRPMRRFGLDHRRPMPTARR